MNNVFRLGCTEIILFYINFIENNYKSLPENEKKELQHYKTNYVKWFYTTSGFYDKELNYTIENDFVCIPNFKNNINYNKYWEIVDKNIKRECKYIAIKDYIIPLEDSLYTKEFMTMLSSKANIVDIKPNIEMTIDYYNIIQNKNILIISSFGDMIYSQINNGNFYYLAKRLLKTENYNLGKIQCLNTEYTFFNDGSDSNIYDTFKRYLNKIEEINTESYTVILISCGAYSVLFYDYFYDKNKIPIILGGQIQQLFGIVNNRYKNKKQLLEEQFGYDYDKDKEFLLTEIDDKYKPVNYEKIEGGCYW